MADDKPKIPRLVAGLDVKALPLTPVEGFVLSRIDGTASISDIADLTIQDVGEVRSILGRLERLSAIEWADQGITLPRTSFKPTSMMPRVSTEPPRGPESAIRIPQAAPVPVVDGPPSPPGQQRGPELRHGSSRPGAIRQKLDAPVPVEGARPGSSRPGAPRSLEPAPVAAAPASSPPPDGLEIPEERRKKIDELWVALDLLGHYEVLGIKRSASKAEVRSAYFELSKAFHPDTVFRKNVGAYRQKMEGIFKRLTEAYDVLGKAKGRAEYDAYLESIGETKEAEEALSGEHEIPASVLEAAASLAAAAPAPTREPPARPISDAAPRAPTSDSGSRPVAAPLPPSSVPTEEGKKRARELLARKLEGATTSAVARPRQAPVPDPAPAAVPRTKDELVRDLTGAIRASSSLTGGGDAAARLFIDAKRAAEAGDLARAVRDLRVAIQAAPDRDDYQTLYDKVSKELSAQLATRYLEQAQYEERHGKWAAAALSWSKVCEGRPDDSVAHYRAATALVEAKGDLHKAQELAQRALQLRGESGEVRRLLGRIYLAAGLPLNARRELQAAIAIDAKDAAAHSLLAQIKS